MISCPNYYAYKDTKKRLVAGLWLFALGSWLLAVGSWLLALITPMAPIALIALIAPITPANSQQLTAKSQLSRYRADR